jgi:hypothetical protein
MMERHGMAEIEQEIFAAFRYVIVLESLSPAREIFEDFFYHVHNL